MFGLSVSQSVSFQSGQIVKSLEIGQAYAEIQDQISNDCDAPDPITSILADGDGD
ncbi:hypothetical protein KBC89_05650 [Candidatus Woesebacteria bacterium]|nr:hypothetical protein [Candidatus Woesebacteria bacterium]